MKTRLPSARLPALLLIPALSTGCEDLEAYMPTVRFQSLEPQAIDFQGAQVDFVFNVDNPNPINVGLSSFSYALGLENVDLFSGSDADGMELEAVGTSELRLPIAFEWQGIWDTIQATRGQDMVGFGLDGDFGFATPVGEALIPYGETGEFPAVRTPKFNFRKVRVTGVDLLAGRANLAVDLGIDNDHGSTLFFENFDYRLSLGGKRVATGLISDFGSVDGASTGEFSLPLSVNVLDVGDQVWQAINGRGNLNVGLKANTDVDSPFGLIPLTIDQTGDVKVE